MGVITVGSVPAEKLAYALARYSRSSDSITESLAWVKEHDSSKFLDSFYFQYGHASIADLGHLPLCFEGISELAATELEDEQLWDGQARSTRYQDFSGSSYVVPPGLSPPEIKLYEATADVMLECYRQVHKQMAVYYKDTLPRPDGMDVGAYGRAVNARAFDVARYLLFWGIPTGVGQVTSIRTLEKQMARIGATPYPELHRIQEEVRCKLKQAPDVSWHDGDTDPVAPTLAKYLGCDQYSSQAMDDLRQWAGEWLPCEDASSKADQPTVELVIPERRDSARDIAATLLYPLTGMSYGHLFDYLETRDIEQVLNIVYTTRQKSEAMRAFRTQPYVFDIKMDIGAYRDLHRHRRVQHFRKQYDFSVGFATPQQIHDSGCQVEYYRGIDAARMRHGLLPPVAREYILPFATYGRFLMKMDAAEVDYITRLRTGVKGHFSYRKVAFMMAEAFVKAEPTLGKYLEPTHPDVVDELKR
jgi:thymidylate synthase ThyX